MVDGGADGRAARFARRFRHRRGRHHAQQAAVGGQRAGRAAVRPPADVADALAEAFQQALLAGDAVAVDAEARHEAGGSAPTNRLLLRQAGNSSPV
jgi:hypothetical protein